MESHLLVNFVLHKEFPYFPDNQQLQNIYFFNPEFLSVCDGRKLVGMKLSFIISYLIMSPSSPNSRDAIKCLAQTVFLCESSYRTAIGPHLESPCPFQNTLWDLIAGVARGTPLTCARNLTCFCGYTRRVLFWDHLH